jgi:hypothetical protein
LHSLASRTSGDIFRMLEFRERTRPHQWGTPLRRHYTHPVGSSFPFILIEVGLQVTCFRNRIESFSLCLLPCYMLLTISRPDQFRHTSRAYRAREQEKGNRKWKNGSRL